MNNVTMNNTTMVSNNDFLDIEKAFLPIVFVPCFLLCLILYYFGRQSMPNPNSTYSRKIQFFNVGVSGIALGQFIFHTTRINNNHIVLVILLVSFFIMTCIEKLSRVWHTNIHYTSPPAGLREIKNSIDMDIMEETPYVKVTDLKSDNFSDSVLLIQDETSEIWRRNSLAIICYIILLFTMSLEGFYLIYKAPHVIEISNGGLVAFFYIHKLLETYLVFTSMIYALWQTSKSGRFWYFILAFLWCSGCALSTLPILLNLNVNDTIEILEFPATWVIQGILSGMLFWITLQFLRLDLKETDVSDTIVQLFIFGLALALSCTTSFFV